MASRSNRLCALRAAVAALAGVASGAEGQDLEPRAYANTPVGINFLIVGYAHTQGGVATDPALPIKDARVEVHSIVTAYLHSLDLLGKSARFGMVLPYAWAAGSATATGRFRAREVAGLADPVFSFSVNLYGAPALSLEEFAAYQQDIIVGASLRVTAPGGQYDTDKLLNLGTHRWSVRPEVGISKRLGPLTLELDGSVAFYTDNPDYFGGRVRAQAPLYAVQGHLIYSFGHNIWAAVDGTFYTGGRTTVDGTRNNDLQENSRIGATLVLPVNRHNSVKLYASTGVATRSGSNFDAVGIAWQYRFGGGL